MAHPTKLVLDGTENIQLINEIGGNQLTTTQSISDLAGGGSSKATFLFNGAFFNSTVPAPDFYLPITSEGEGNSIQRYNTIVVPVTAQLKKVVVALTGAALSDGDITVDFQERNTTGSGASSIESQTVDYTADIAEVNGESVYEFTFTSSAVASPGRGVFLHISGTFTGVSWGNLVWSAYFEEI